VNIAEEAWADWLAPERLGLEGLALDAMIRCAEQALQSGDAESALKAAHRAISVNALREDAHRLIVQALAATGRKAEALKHYQGLVALLKRELNTEPDAATGSLVGELRATEPASRSPVVKIAKPALPQPDRSWIAVLGNPEEMIAENPPAWGDAASVRPYSPERRHLTIMACSMVGSMALSARLDPEDMGDLIASFHKVVADVVSRFDGFVGQYLGEGVLIYFGYPAAHEHDTEQAVRAGLAILDAVRRRKVASDVTVQARVGIATGLVVIGEPLGTGDTRQRVAIGETPNLASMLQAAAAPGEGIAASTRRLVGGCLTAARSVPTRLGAAATGGGVAGARRDGRCQPLRGAARGRAVPLAGRQRDRSAAAPLGSGQAARVGSCCSGEPGIGKSRIA
jgi:class 3 adenylate cyclase